MVAPVVLVTVGGIFTGGLQTALGTVTDRLSGLHRERLAILAGPNGEVLGEHSLTPIDRERLIQIREQMPLIAWRVRRIKGAAILSYGSMALLVLSTIVIAVAVTAGSRVFALTAMVLVLAGTLAQFAGIATIIGLLVRSSDALVYETTRSEEPTVADAPRQ
jgi:hypothetical protein